MTANCKSPDERAILKDIRSNPNDIVARLLRLHSLSPPNKILSEVEEAITEIIALRCRLRQTR